jgi:hypothetical protein
MVLFSRRQRRSWEDPVAHIAFGKTADAILFLNEKYNLDRDQSAIRLLLSCDEAETLMLSVGVFGDRSREPDDQAAPGREIRFLNVWRTICRPHLRNSTIRASAS